jgi:hypothetical protein
MSRVARDYLAIPASEVDYKRLFSGGRDLLGIRRYSINANTIRTMMLLKGVLKSIKAKTLEERRQDASKMPARANNK